MKPKSQFTFKPVEAKDRALVHEWLVQPYVAEWFYGEGLQNTYMHLDEFIAGSSEGQYWLAYDNSTPFAFFITSLVQKPNDELSQWCEAAGTTITLDMLIGDVQYLGRGLSHLLIKEFLLNEFQDVEEVLIDPEASNSKAVHVYEKVGFKILDEFIPSHSPHIHYMMRLNMSVLREDLSNEITIRSYQQGDEQEIAYIYYNTIHKVNIQDYTQEQVNAWAPLTSLETNRWLKKFEAINPLVAVIDGQIVGFAEFEANGHIGCFFCHHEWIGKGVGSALMRAINTQATQKKIHRIFTEVSITARPFFEKQGFFIICEHVDIKRGVELMCYKMERKKLKKNLHKLN